jgi:hypothetical protein
LNFLHKLTKFDHYAINFEFDLLESETPSDFLRPQNCPFALKILFSLTMAFSQEEQCYRKKAASVGQSGRLSTPVTFSVFDL